MKDTTFYPGEAQQKRLATGYLKSRKTGLLRVQALPFDATVLKSLPPVPAGGLFSTAGDLARFCQMLLNRGMLDGKRYLSETSYHALTTIQTGDLPNHALGWGLGVYVVRTPHEVVSAGLSAGTLGHAPHRRSSERTRLRHARAALKPTGQLRQRANPRIPAGRCPSVNTRRQEDESRPRLSNFTLGAVHLRLPARAIRGRFAGAHLV
jgi:hypothetical protein